MMVFFLFFTFMVNIYMSKEMKSTECEIEDLLFAFNGVIIIVHTLY